MGLLFSSELKFIHFAAFISRPGRASGPAVLVLPDNRGLSGFYERLTARLAEQGHTALAVGCFGRTAGTDPRPDDFPFMEHLLKLHKDGLFADIATGVARLRAEASEKIVSLGFCFGLAFLAARGAAGPSADRAEGRPEESAEGRPEIRTARGDLTSPRAVTTQD